MSDEPDLSPNFVWFLAGGWIAALILWALFESL